MTSQGDLSMSGQAVLTITPIGSGTIGLDKPLSVTATNAGTGTTNGADLSAPFGAQVLAFAVSDGAAINSMSRSLMPSTDAAAATVRLPDCTSLRTSTRLTSRSFILVRAILRT